ncbi:MAG: hypothetical protein IJS13_01695 [Paludibacteraceae bacterium]|nr:hypothetical protein [Paludibacteraceae bacterium]
MKTSLKLLCCAICIFLGIFFTGCDTPETLENVNYSFCFFKLKDSKYKDYIIMTQHDAPLISNWNPPIMFDTCIVPLFPKREYDKPYFLTNISDPMDYFYNECDLAEADIYYNLHDGYLTFFPYTSIGAQQNECTLLKEKWSEICGLSPDNVTILEPYSNIFEEVWVIKITTLEKLTHKSRSKMTMQDIELAINMIIDNETIEKYCFKVGYPMFSRR